MKDSRAARAVALIVFWLLAACGGAAASPATTTVRPAPSPSPVRSETPTTPPPATVAPPPTVTAAPSQTPGPSPIPSATPTATATPLVFAAIGDYGLAGQPAADVAALVKSWQPAFIITTGDNNYPDGQAATIDDNIGQYYHEYIYPYRGEYGEGAAENRFFPSLGNHDWNTLNAQPYLDYFELPGNERTYDFVWGPVHFFALDSDSREPDGFRAGSAQAEWLRAALASSSSPWRLVYMHHPPYSSAHHGPIAWMQWPFGEWEASAVMAGHDHVYERLEVGGLTYITNGLGGYPARYAFITVMAGSQVRFNADYGAMRLEATEDYFQFEFVTGDGEVIDRYELTARPDSGP